MTARSRNPRPSGRGGSQRAYLPFVGMVDLDARDIVGKTLERLAGQG